MHVIDLLLTMLTSVQPYRVPLTVGGIIVLFSVFFVWLYVVKAIKISRKINKQKDDISTWKEDAPETKLRKLSDLFTKTAMEHAWSEFSKSLHKQRDVIDGELKLKNIRATAPAAAYFTEQQLVDIPLSTEFIKHLPGILTGVGIIGTFYGLMIGLYHFDPSTPEQVTSSVAALLRDVLYAFLGSFFAITASIAVTWLEKFLIAKCYKNLEKLAAAIDQLFESGVGEEYLAELVKSGNESATQAKQLKDSLVTDLREMLQNLVASQATENEKLAQTLSSTYRDSGQIMAEQIGGAIENSLKSPLDKIAGAVQTASGEQTGQAATVLQDMLSAFMTRLDNTFGKQFEDMHVMMGQSVSAIEAMQSGFSSLLQDMRSASEETKQGSTELIAQLINEMKSGQVAIQSGMSEMLASLQSSVAKIGAEGEGAGERMARQLEKMFADSEAREKAMADQMKEFIASIQQTSEQGQHETMQKMAASVETLGEQLGSMFTQLEQGQKQLTSHQQDTQASLHQETQQIVSGFDEQIKALLIALNEQREASENTLRRLAEQTTTHLQDMHTGADKMRVAADRFETAGDKVKEANNLTADVLNKAQSAGSELSMASHELSSVVADYRNNREAVAKSISLLEGVVANAQAELAARSQFLKELKQHSESLHDYNREAREFLESSGQVLANGFNQFSDGMKTSLDTTLGALDANLDTAVKRLGSGIDELGESIETLEEVLSKVPA
ncbi:type I Zorya anti-phage system protein ZorA1 [Pantoea sp. CCBC3-3-1]|uniref:type I Zorya anti-phage system protein ZorA1 n=1 Tax=Pantoea sp. CCBC3-3-1 TaxID=2490851 RepID=UPI0011BDDE9B|nr:type I Zorya anti-phage system protein ZorA1 [Pantoea sp. CCBC3-3-1]